MRARRDGGAVEDMLTFFSQPTQLFQLQFVSVQFLILTLSVTRSFSRNPDYYEYIA